MWPPAVRKPVADMTTVIERPEAASGPLVAPGGVVGPAKEHHNTKKESNDNG